MKDLTPRGFLAVESRAAAEKAAYLASKPVANPEQDELDEIVENLDFDT